MYCKNCNTRKDRTQYFCCAAAACRLSVNPLLLGQTVFIMTKIYYFSGTGSSLWSAGKIAQVIGSNCELFNIGTERVNSFKNPRFFPSRGGFDMMPVSV